jgi:hypothetical protein
MPPLNYSKWDNLDDSDDDEPQQRGGRSQAAVGRDVPNVKPASGEEDQKKSATVKAGFIVRTMAQNGGVPMPLYVNVCESSSVPGGGMTAAPSSADGLAANMPYIAGDPRQDFDGAADCIVVEFIYAPDTMRQAEANKQAHEVCIKTALAVLGKHYEPLQIDQQRWAIFERDEVQEKTLPGKYFFAPGKLDMRAVE